MVRRYRFQMAGTCGVNLPGNGEKAAAQNTAHPIFVGENTIGVRKIFFVILSNKILRPMKGGNDKKKVSSYICEVCEKRIIWNKFIAEEKGKEKRLRSVISLCQGCSAC